MIGENWLERKSFSSQGSRACGRVCDARGVSRGRRAFDERARIQPVEIPLGVAADCLLSGSRTTEFRGISQIHLMQWTLVDKMRRPYSDSSVVPPSLLTGVHPTVIPGRGNST